MPPLKLRRTVQPGLPAGWYPPNGGMLNKQPCPSPEECEAGSETEQGQPTPTKSGSIDSDKQIRVNRLQTVDETPCQCTDPMWGGGQQASETKTGGLLA